MGHVSVERHGEVALVRIDRPPANAMDLDLLVEGHAVCAELERDDPGAIVLTGRDGYFSAGVDLKVAPGLDEAAQREMVIGINRLFLSWYSMPRPVVAAVNGHAIAGGLILALCCDYRVCATSGKFGVTEVKVGVPYPAVAIAIVAAELSPPVARRLALTSELVGPPRALELGLVDELAEPAEVLPRALELAAELAAQSRGAYAAAKRDLRGDVIDRAERVVAEGSDPLLAGWLG